MAHRAESKPSTERRLNIGIALTLAVLLAMVVTAGYSAWSFRDAGDRVLAKDDLLRRLEQLRADAAAMQSAGRGFMITGETRFRESFEDRRRALARDISELVPLLPPDLGGGERGHAIGVLVEQLAAEVEAGVRLRAASDEASAEAHVASGRGQVLLESIQRDTGLLSTEVARRRDAQIAAARDKATRTAWILAFGLTLDFVLLGLVLVVGRQHLRARARAEQAQEAARRYADDIVDTLRESLVILSADLEVRRANRSFYVAFDTTPEAVVGRRFAEVGGGHWNLPDLLEKLATIVPAHAELVDHEVTVHLAGAGPRVMLLNASKLYRPGNNTELLVLAIEDVTARRRAEENVRQLNENLRTRAAQLEAANAELESFSYSVSHDLRAPLRHIDGFAQLLRRKAGEALDATAKRYIETIAESARKMGVLIDELLQFSRLGRTELRHRVTDMRALVEEVRHELEPDAAGRNVEWRIGTLPSVQADAALLRQVWRNLLGNAVKYTRRRDLAVIEVSHQKDGDGGAVFAVRDNGAGFEMEYAAKLFGVFQRLHSDRDFEGTGVGLATVRRIVQRHGGRTWAEGRPGEGATFYFSLPVAVPATTVPATLP